MNILILNWKDIKHPEVGGAEIIVYEIVRRLVLSGHKITWFSSSYRNGLSEDYYDGIHVIRKGSKISMFLHAPRFYASLSIKPDVVIDMSNTILWQTPLWVKKSTTIAYLNQFADLVFDYEYPAIVSFFGKLYERFQYSTYKHTSFLCYSESSKKDLRSVGIPDKNIYLFPMGLDIARYSTGKKTRYPLFICVNRLVKMKRTDLAIQAFKYVIKREPDAKLYIIGYGYDRKRLERIRNSLGLQKSVLFEDEDILFFNKNIKDKKTEYMKKAWALIFPSVKEGWGMTVTECAACGTPAIVTKVSGLTESVIAGYTGLVVSKNPSPEELGQAIVKIIQNPALRKQLSENAYNQRKKFNWDSTANEFIKIVDYIVKRN